MYKFIIHINAPKVSLPGYVHINQVANYGKHVCISFCFVSFARSEVLHAKILQNKRVELVP